MSAVYLEFAFFLRDALTRRDLSVSQAWKVCGTEIPISNWYQWLRGERVPCSWQLKRIEKRLNFNTPDSALRGNDRFGVPIKDRQMKLKLRDSR